MDFPLYRKKTHFKEISQTQCERKRKNGLYHLSASMWHPETVEIALDIQVQIFEIYAQNFWTKLKCLGIKF